MGTESKGDGQVKAKGAARKQESATVQAVPATIRKGIYLSALIYVEGDQAPAENFNALAKAALKQRLTGKGVDGLQMTLKKVEEKTDVEDDGDHGEPDATAGGKKEDKFDF
jgi:hypothetical protein